MVYIYADLVFLINFVMDMLIFWIASKLIKKKVYFKNIVIGCFISTLLFCLVIFIPALRINYNFFTMLIVLIIGIVIGYRPQSVREVIKYIIITNIVSFSIGGMGTALFYFTNISDVIGNMEGFSIKNFSFKLLLVISASAYIILKFSINFLRKNLVKKQKFLKVLIKYDEKEASLNALLDTGNTLSDPITDMPVIIAEFDIIKDLLPNDLITIFYEGKENNISNLLDGISQNFTKRIRMIPFVSLGNQNGMLLGFRPDFIEIIDNENIIKNENVIIGIYKYKLSKNEDYNGLINPAALNLF